MAEKTVKKGHALQLRPSYVQYEHYDEADMSCAVSLRISFQALC